MGAFYDAVIKIRENGKQMKLSETVEDKNAVKSAETVKNKMNANPIESTAKDSKSAEVKNNDKGRYRKS